MAKDIRFETPLMWLNKAETRALADYWGQLDLVRRKTLTCYNGIKGDGCGQCAACNLRANGLNQYLADKVGVMAVMQQNRTGAGIISGDRFTGTLKFPGGAMLTGATGSSPAVGRHSHDGCQRRFIWSSFARNSPSSGSAFWVFKSIQTKVISASATTSPLGLRVTTA